jgi:curli biogenesis system outer membrane secretion channel CsgG
MKNAGEFLRRFVWIALVCVLISSTAEAEAKPRLAVRAFDNKTDERSVPAAAITDMMTTELYKAGLFSLMEREKLDYIADEIRLGQSGLMDPSTAPELGKVKGAQYTMTGAVTVYHYNAKGGAVVVPGVGGGAAAKTAYVTLDIRVLDNTTGEVVYAAAEQGTAKREGAGLVAMFPGFAAGGASASYGGILAAATRDAVTKHAASIKQYDWE